MNMKVYKNLTELIGNTPLIELKNYNKKNNLQAIIYGKVEYFNPAGSVKDRAVKYMLEEAEGKEILKAGGTIIEPTSGNTGIGLAALGVAKGYKVILVMPETMSIERRNLIKAYGGEIVLTEGAKGMMGAIKEAEELLLKTPDAFMPRQFENEANALAHRETTGPEIWRDLEGTIDIFVAGVGTGGTITGVGEYLKKMKPSVKIVAVEPAASPVLSGKAPGPHLLQGIGAGFVPKLLNESIYDEIIQVESREALESRKQITATEGILVGISSGAALYAATILAKRPENKGKKIVVLLPDTGERYLTVKDFI